jgi:hypothetical protein
MASRRPNTTERRLAHVRAIKEQFYAEELTLQEQLDTKDERIAELEREVEFLQERLQLRAEPESVAPPRPEFNFYRD